MKLTVMAVAATRADERSSGARASGSQAGRRPAYHCSFTLNIIAPALFLLGIYYVGIYIPGGFILSMQLVDDLERCQTDVLQVAENKGQIGRLASLSGACASVEATTAIARGVLR